MANIYFKDIIEFYPYRTAMAAGETIFSCKLWTTAQISELRKTLAHKGFALDNHICWRTENACFMYSDNELICCTDLLVKKW